MKNIKKIICLILIFSLAFSGTQNVTAAKKHYSTKSVDWGLGLNNNHATPGGTVPYSGFSLKKYYTIYTGNTKKKCIYLTQQLIFVRDNPPGDLCCRSMCAFSTQRV